MFFGLTAIDHPCCKMQEAVESFFFKSIDQVTFSTDLFPVWIRTTIRQTNPQVASGTGSSGATASTPRRTTLGDRFEAVHAHLHSSSMSCGKRRAIYNQLYVTNQIEELCGGKVSIPLNEIDWKSDLGFAISELMEALYSSLDLAVFRRPGQTGQPTHQFYTEFTKTNCKVDPILRPGKRKVKLAWSRAWM
jgi:hypothetical protein